jgi:hypothetical protein
MGSKKNKYVPRAERIKIDQECKARRREALVAKKAK